MQIKHAINTKETFFNFIFRKALRIPKPPQIQKHKVAIPKNRKGNCMILNTFFKLWRSSQGNALVDIKRNKKPARKYSTYTFVRMKSNLYPIQHPLKYLFNIKANLCIIPEKKKLNAMRSQKLHKIKNWSVTATGHPDCENMSTKSMDTGTLL